MTIPYPSPYHSSCFCFGEMINLQCIFIQSTEKRLPLILMIHAWLSRCTWIRKVLQKNDINIISLGLNGAQASWKGIKISQKGLFAIPKQNVLQFPRKRSSNMHQIWKTRFMGYLLFIDLILCLLIHLE